MKKQHNFIKKVIKKKKSKFLEFFSLKSKNPKLKTIDNDIGFS